MLIYRFTHRLARTLFTLQYGIRCKTRLSCIYSLAFILPKDTTMNASSIRHAKPRALAMALACTVLTACQSTALSGSAQSGGESLHQTALSPLVATPIKHGQEASTQTTASAPARRKFSATGYGSPSAFGRYTISQRRLLAIRAAKVDAFRAMAEQVHGFRISANTAVADFVTQSDSVRVWIDAFIRGARVANVRNVSDGNYEVTLELDIPPNFKDCVQNQSCAMPATRPAPMPAPTAAATSTSGTSTSAVAASKSCKDYPGCTEPAQYYQ